MPQFVGSVRDERTVRDLLVAVARPAVRAAALAVDAAELAIMERDDEAAQLAYAQALSDWGDAGGYAAETVWDMCTMAALGVPYEKAAVAPGPHPVRRRAEAPRPRGAAARPRRGAAARRAGQLPGRPRQAVARGQLRDTAKTVLFVSHDRELLARAAEKIVSVEPAPGGSDVWVHGGGFGHRSTRRAGTASSGSRNCAGAGTKSTPSSRSSSSTCGRTPRRSDAMASRYAAAQTRLRKFEEAGPPPEPPREQDITMRLRGGRTGMRAITCAGLELTGLMKPFGLEVFYGERVAVLGSNGSGKSHFLRLLAGDSRWPTPASWKLGARVVAGFFAQTHAHPELVGRTLVEHPVGPTTPATAAPRWACCAATSWSAQGEQRFGNLSGGQQARFQILLLELRARRRCCSTSRPTTSTSTAPRPCRTALESYEGTVLAVTHDRWFARTFDRFLVFGADGSGARDTEPVWDETRVERAR